MAVLGLIYPWGERVIAYIAGSSAPAIKSYSLTGSFKRPLHYADIKKMVKYMVIAVNLSV